MLNGVSFNKPKTVDINLCLVYQKKNILAFVYKPKIYNWCKIKEASTYFKK